MLTQLIQALRAALAGRPQESSLARSAITTVGVSFASTAVGFALSVILARVLGTDGFGIYTFALSIAITCSVIAKLGLSQPLIRDIASLDSLPDPPDPRSLVRTADKHVAVAGLAVAVLVSLAILVMSPPTSQRHALVWALPLIPLLALESNHGSALRGLGFVARGHAIVSLTRPALLVALILAVAIAGSAPSPTLAMQLHSLAAALSLAIGTTWLLRRTIRVGEPARPWRFAGTGTFLLLDGLQTLSSHVDVLVLGLLMAPADLGVYRVAVNMGTLVLFFALAAVIVVQPEFARLSSKQETKALQRLVTQQTRLTSATTAVLILGFAVLGQPVLRTFFGPDFVVAFAPMLIIAVGQLFNALMGPVGTVLNMSGHQADTVRGFALGIGSTILGMLLLVPRFGLLGAAWTHATATVVWNLYLVRCSRNRLGINTTILMRYQT